MYVFPSIDEGFGIPLIEALKLKVPVICSDIPIFKEIANDSVIYFEKQNEIHLFEKMKELIQSKNLSKKLIIKGAERVKKFNRRNFIKDFEKPIKNILLTHSSNDLYGASKVLISTIEILILNGFKVHLILPSNGPLNYNETIKKLN